MFSINYVFSIFLLILVLLHFFTFYYWASRQKSTYLIFTKSLKCQCHIRNLLVWRQGRFSDPRGRLPGGRDLDAGHRDPQPEEVLHPRCPLQARRALAEQGHGADLCCRLQACHPDPDPDPSWFSFVMISLLTSLFKLETSS